MLGKQNKRRLKITIVLLIVVLLNLILLIANIIERRKMKKVLEIYNYNFRFSKILNFIDVMEEFERKSYNELFVDNKGQLYYKISNCDYMKYNLKIPELAKD